MTIVFYLNILLPFAALFAVGYFPVRLLARILAEQPGIGSPDILAPLAGAVGTAVGFLVVGVSGYDRFALAPDRVRNAWMSSGLSFPFELAQSLFSGLVCAVVVVSLNRLLPDPARRMRILTPVAALAISAVNFACWPVLLSPWLR